MELPDKALSFEVRINRFNTSEGVVALNGLSKISELVDGFDDEMKRQKIYHSKEMDENGEVIFNVHFNTAESLEPRYDWPALANILGWVALKQDIDPTILIRDPGKVTDRLATDIPVLRS